MSEPTDAIDVLNDVPFKVAALEKVTAPGSYEKALIRAVYDSVRQDIKYAVDQIQSDRKRASEFGKK